MVKSTLVFFAFCLIIGETVYASGPLDTTEAMVSTTHPCENSMCGWRQSSEFIRDYENFFPKNPNKQFSICSVGEDKLKRLIKTSPGPLENKKFISSIKKSHVIIAGETHLYTDLKARTAMIKLIKDLKGPKSCVAFELPNRPEGVVTFMSKLKKIAAQSQKGNDVEAAIAQKDFLTYYDPMINYATSIKLKVSAVDHSQNFEADIPNNIRNQTMAINIARKIQNRECDSVLLFVGKAHEAKPDKESSSISELLKSRGLVSTSVNLQMAYEYATPMDLRTWNLCDGPLDRFEKKIQKEVVFDRSEIPEHIRIAPQSEIIRFSDFDFTWLIPFQNQDIACSSCVK